MITSITFLNYLPTSGASFPLLRAYKVKEHRIFTFWAWPEMPCGLTFGTGNCTTFLTNRLPVVDAMRRDEHCASQSVAVGLVPSIKLQLLRFELLDEALWETRLYQPQRDPGGAAAWWIKCFIFQGYLKELLEATTAVSMHTTNFHELTLGKIRCTGIARYVVVIIVVLRVS